jgi:hypothetical protein
MIGGQETDTELKLEDFQPPERIVLIADFIEGQKI